MGLLATMVMIALTAFYISSQHVWIDGSTQALAQRDGTLLIDEMRRRVHEAKQATIASTDADHDQLTLVYAGTALTVDFVWNATDQRVHLFDSTFVDRGPIVDTPVTRFHLTTRDSTMVELTRLDLKTANGDSVSMASRFSLLGG